MSRPAVVLLSGGLDSTTTLAIACDQGFAPHAITFRYGQRHQIEIEAARRVASRFPLKQHTIVDIDLAQFGGSALTSSTPVPKSPSVEAIREEIPPTYVPARNTIFLSFALALAEVIPAGDIFIGVNAVDYSGYPDCRPEFIRAFESMANLATKAAVEGTPTVIHAPLIAMKKSEIILQGMALGVDYGITTSCYDPDPSGTACGRCDACLLRRQGFQEAGCSDPVAYPSWIQNG